MLLKIGKKPECKCKMTARKVRNTYVIHLKWEIIQWFDLHSIKHFIKPTVLQKRIHNFPANQVSKHTPEFFHWRNAVLGKENSTSHDTLWNAVKDWTENWSPLKKQQWLYWGNSFHHQRAQGVHDGAAAEVLKPDLWTASLMRDLKNCNEKDNPYSRFAAMHSVNGNLFILKKKKKKCNFSVKNASND